MMWLALRGLRAQWRRSALTGLAGIVGVAVVSGTLIVGDTADRAGTAGPDISFVQMIMLLAGGVALLVGAFIVNLTMSVTVAQRTRELALLRCVGAASSQLRRIVLLEAVFVGVFTSGVGLAVGYAVATALRALINTPWFPGNLPGRSFVLTPRTMVAALVVGCFTIVLAALAPASRASRVSPVAALRDQSRPHAGIGVFRLVSGLSIVVGGLALVAVTVATADGPLLFAAAALILVGIRLAGPTVAGLLAAAAGAPVAALGLAAWLGRKNATRSPDRTAATASALMIGLALLTFVNVLYASSEKPILDDLDRDHAAFQVWAEDQQHKAQPIDPVIVGRLRALPQVREVVTVDCVGDPSKGGELCAADPAAVARVIDLKLVAGSLSGLGSGDVGVADDEGAALGSVLQLGQASVTVKAIYQRNGNFDRYLLTRAAFARVGGTPRPVNALLRVNDRGDLYAARSAVVAALVPYPNMQVHDRAEQHSADLGQIQRAAAVYRTLTGLAALVGLFGIASILTLSIVERRRELGLLRGAGMQRAQVRAMIRAEALIEALVGAILGLVVGGLFGWATARVLEHSSQPTQFTLPYATMGATAVLVALAGVLAAAVPARLAACVDLLSAIASD